MSEHLTHPYYTHTHTRTNLVAKQSINIKITLKIINMHNCYLNFTPWHIVIQEMTANTYAGWLFTHTAFTHYQLHVN